MSDDKNPEKWGILRVTRDELTGSIELFMCYGVGFDKESVTTHCEELNTNYKHRHLYVVIPVHPDLYDFNEPHEED